MSIAAGKRRRRQAANGYTHLAKIGRPIYKKKSKDKMARRLAAVISGEKMRQQRKGASSK